MRLKSYGHFMSTVMPRKGVRRCVGLTQIAILFFMITAIAAAEEMKQRQIVGDVEIVLAVPHAEEAPDYRVESQDEHHLVIWLFDRVTAKPIADALVNAEVAKVGYAGSEKMLQPRMIDGKPAYSGFFIMPGRVTYRISVQVMRPGVPRVIEAHFEYRHHHKLK